MWHPPQRVKHSPLASAWPDAERSGLLKKEKVQLTGEDMREGLTAIVSVKLPDPKFGSQTKDKLVSSEVRQPLESLMGEKMTEWLEENPAEAKAIIRAVVGLADSLGMETVAEGVDLVQNLENLFSRLRDDIGEPELILGCDCILRSLEMEQKQIKHMVSKVLSRNNVIGFCTYGEQFNAMHVNQTFTGVAIGARCKA